MKRIFTLVSILACLFAGALLAQEATPDFSGRWSLNNELSDDMSKIMKRAHSGPRMPTGGRGGGRGGGPGGGMGGGQGGPPPGGVDGGPSDRMQKGAREMSKRQAQLDIFHAGDELNITDGLEITRLLHTDGQPHPVWTEMGQATAVATWHEDLLEVVWRNERHPQPRTRRYRLIDDGARLQITEAVLLPDQNQPTTIKLIYDRLADPAETPGAQ